MPIVAIEHVQLAKPAGMEQVTRELYRALSGFPKYASHLSSPSAVARGSSADQ
jgi:hypothetical protein